MYQPPAYGVSAGPCSSANQSQMSSSRTQTAGTFSGGFSVMAFSSRCNFFRQVRRAMAGATQQQCAKVEGRRRSTRVISLIPPTIAPLFQHLAQASI